MSDVIFVERRKNPPGRSIPNNQRFTRRARARLKERIAEAVQRQKIKGDVTDQTIPIPDQGIIAEPVFRPDPQEGGVIGGVHNGNKEFVKGDKIPKPQGGRGAGGKEASNSGEGEDEFLFALTREEFLNIFFEDLELPDLVKTDLQQTTAFKRRRAGFSSVGTPPNLNVRQTMIQSKGRRVALRRPSFDDIEHLDVLIDELEERLGRVVQPEEKDEAWHADETELERLYALRRRSEAVPFIDPHDLRFNQHVLQPEPNTKAVMFCIMDVSGSMGEREKDLAKRFFMLLNLFLERHYEDVDVVFIRHTHEAKEVDEETFFYSPESGGTIVSTSLRLALDIIKERYLSGQWNIYVAQASDGENYGGDSDRCVAILTEYLMRLLQFYFYVEILDEREAEIFKSDDSAGADLWKKYNEFRGGLEGTKVPNFAMKRVAKPADIYPVFRSLFEKHASQKGGRS